MTQAIRIPGPESSTKADIAFVVVVGGVEYDARLQWLPRVKEWSLFMRGANGEPVIDGLRVAADTSLIGAFADLRLPQLDGHLLCVDTTGAHQDPTRRDLQMRHVWMYIVPETTVEDFTIRVDEQVINPT